jgi:hypothetical protein
VFDGIEAESVEVESFDPIDGVGDEKLGGGGLVVVKSGKKRFEPGGELGLGIPFAEIFSSIGESERAEPVGMILKGRMILMNVGEDEIQNDAKAVPAGGFGQRKQSFVATEAGLYLGGGERPVAVVARIPATWGKILLKRLRRVLVDGGEPESVDAEFFEVAVFDQLANTDQVASEILCRFFDFGIGGGIIFWISIDHPIDEGEVDDVIETVGIGLGFGSSAGTGRSGESAVLAHGGETDPRVGRKRGGIDFPATGLGRGGGDEAGGAVGEFGDAREGGGFPSCGGGEEGEEAWLVRFCVEESGGGFVIRNLDEGIFIPCTVGHGEGMGGVEAPIAVHDELVGLGTWGEW